MRYKKPEAVHIQGTCVIDGCNEPQAVVKKGKYNARCSKHRRSEWLSDAPETIKYKSIKRLYGLEKNEYDSLLEYQEHKCYICGTPEEQCSKGTLNVDHCHSTGKVRGLLCLNCNTAIGHFREDPELLQRAIEYLKKNA
jgi:hypothetical protein